MKQLKDRKIEPIKKPDKTNYETGSNTERHFYNGSKEMG